MLKMSGTIPTVSHMRSCLAQLLFTFTYSKLGNNFYHCTMHYGIYILLIHQQLHFLLNLKKFKFTLEYTQLSLIHVSVFDHSQGACTEPG